jgi:CelD/BcsL family acetyltransferase involved in cellulose biosynthesis
MSIEVIDTLERLEKVETDWLDLWQSCPTATPFQSPQWLLPWTRHLFGGGKICALAMRDTDRLIGFAPLFRWGTQQVTVSFMGAGISDYGDLLFAPGREAECVSTVRRILTDKLSDWDVLDLQELRRGSGLLDALADGWRAEECSICPVLDLSTFPAAMDHKHRTDVRRARNKLSKSGDLRFATANETTLAAYLDEFFRLHDARWGPLSDSLQRFHREVAQGFLKTGHLRLSLLQTGKRTAAAIYAFVCGKTLYCYLSGFDPDMAKLSPGAVLLGWVIEQAIAEGLAEVDFLRQGEAYKYLWGARDRTNYVVTAEQQR